MKLYVPGGWLEIRAFLKKALGVSHTEWRMLFMSLRKNPFLFTISQITWCNYWPLLQVFVVCVLGAGIGGRGWRVEVVI